MNSYMDASKTSADLTPADTSLNSQTSDQGSQDSSAKSTAVLRMNPLWRLLRFPFWWFCRLWVRLHISGQENVDVTRGGLFLINHQSFLDPLLVAVFLGRPVSYLARDNLFRIPILGSILRKTHVIPISREAARGGSIRVALERLEGGFLVGIFPEGTRSADGQVHKFRPGFLALLRRTSQPIYPVGIIGADRVMPKGAWWIRPGQVEIVFGSPLTPEDLLQFHESTDDGALCELARKRVEECTSKALRLMNPADSPEPAA